MNKTLTQIGEGVITQNPVLTLLLGVCPVLAVSTTLQDGVAMGLCVTAVLICSNTTISLLRGLIPDKIRIVVYAVVIAGFVSLTELLLLSYFPSLSESLGLYLPLIAVSGIMMTHADTFASKNNVIRSVIDGLAAGVGFSLALCVISVIREVLGKGTLFSNGEPVDSPSFSGLVLIPPDISPPILFLVMPMGGFLVLGCLVAVMQKIMKRRFT